MCFIKNIENKIEISKNKKTEIQKMNNPQIQSFQTQITPASTPNIELALLKSAMDMPFPMTLIPASTPNREEENWNEWPGPAVHLRLALPCISAWSRKRGSREATERDTTGQNVEILPKPYVHKQNQHV